MDGDEEAPFHEELEVMGKRLEGDGNMGMDLAERDQEIFPQKAQDLDACGVG